MARGRPRKTDPETVLKTAMKLFWEQGFDGTSMNDLAAQTGMAKPGLYATFGDKEAIYSKALEHYFRDLSAPILDDFMHAADPLEVVLRRLLETIAEGPKESENPCGCFMVKSMLECSNQSDAMKKLGQNFDIERRMAFIKRFQIAQDSGELPKNADANALAEFFAGLPSALSVMNAAETDQTAKNNFINVAMTVLPKSAET
jgi:TetR/AcrR family transcriptional regulator, copper-responsive repressor